MTFEELMDSTPPMQQHALVKGYQAGFAAGAASRAANQPKAYHTECNWCGDPTDDGARYCSRDCASDAYKYQLTLKRNGVNRD